MRISMSNFLSSDPSPARQRSPNGREGPQCGPSRRNRRGREPRYCACCASLSALGLRQHVGGVFLHAGHGLHDRLARAQAGGGDVYIGFFSRSCPSTASGQPSRTAPRPQSRPILCILSYPALPFPLFVPVTRDITINMLMHAHQAQNRCCFISIFLSEQALFSRVFY